MMVSCLFCSEPKQRKSELKQPMFNFFTVSIIAEIIIQNLPSPPEYYNFEPTPAESPILEGQGCEGFMPFLSSSLRQ